MELGKAIHSQHYKLTLYQTIRAHAFIPKLAMLPKGSLQSTQKYQVLYHKDRSKQIDLCD